MKIGFDNEKYLKIQSEHIRERIAQFDGKLYMELGGKLFDDHHASRILPGFQPDSKLRMLAQLRDSIEIVIVISAEDIERNKIRADLGITYDEDVLRLRDEFMKPTTTDRWQPTSSVTASNAWASRPISTILLKAIRTMYSLLPAMRAMERTTS